MKDKLMDKTTKKIPKIISTKYTIPKEFWDKRIAKQIAKQSEFMTTNKENLQSLEDILIRDLEGLSDFIVLERRLKLILLLEQIKNITK